MRKIRIILIILICLLLLPVDVFAVVAKVGANATLNGDVEVTGNLTVEGILDLTDVFSNIFIGTGVGMHNTEGNYNVVLGYYAFFSNITGNCNIAIGDGAIGANTEGDYNTAVGNDAAWHNVTGDKNTAIGMDALYYNETGSNNTAVGLYAGMYHANGSTQLISPENSLYLGYGARGKDNDDSNSIVIGYGAIGQGANTAVLGDSSITKTYLNGGVSATLGFVPDANDGAYLGTTALQFSDLFLAEGGVINWDNGDATLTQVENVVTLAGATFGNKLSDFAATTSAELAGVISDEIGAGKLRFDTAVTAKTTTATLTVAEAGTILVSAASAYTITLPTAVGNTGLTYHFIKTDANYKLITLDGDGTETFNYENSTGAPTLTYARLNTYCAKVTITSDNANWIVTHEDLGQVPYFIAYLGSHQLNLTDSTWIVCVLDTEVIDVGSNFNISTYRFVAPIPGRYIFYPVVAWYEGTLIADKEYRGNLLVNGATYLGQNAQQASSATYGLTNYFTRVVNLVANDYVQMIAMSKSGASTVDLLGTAQGATNLVGYLLTKD